MLICGATGWADGIDDMKGCAMLGSRDSLRNFLRNMKAPNTAAAATSKSPTPSIGRAINQATPMTVKEMAKETRQLMQHKAQPTTSPNMSPQHGITCGINEIGPVMS
mmetsp:Transcript_100625/g.123195  ORF Transcript_100625/g.123195 Transcript_100625/m.123195 type:complete len:107 (+) Transcript_100625:204-524(+)